MYQEFDAFGICRRSARPIEYLVLESDEMERFAVGEARDSGFGQHQDGYEHQRRVGRALLICTIILRLWGYTDC